MFAVLNKDVKSPAYLSLVVYFLLIPLLGNARDFDSITATTDNYYRNNTLHESYEDYLYERNSHVNKTTTHLEKKGSGSSMTIQSYKDRKKINSSKIIIKYTVKKRDTLTRIAHKFNITVSTIKQYNGLNDRDSIRIGMVLKIPSTNNNSQKTKKPDKRGFSDSSGIQPRFRWPMPYIAGYKNDGLDGVKSIGIIITGIPGSKVLSSAPGTVRKIGSMRGFGKYIVINHSGRFNTVYANLSEIRVSEGHTVQSGNIIGNIHSSENKLHFQIDFEGKPENPLKYLPKNI